MKFERLSLWSVCKLKVWQHSDIWKFEKIKRDSLHGGQCTVNLPETSWRVMRVGAGALVWPDPDPSIVLRPKHGTPSLACADPNTKHTTLPLSNCSKWQHFELSNWPNLSNLVQTFKPFKPFKLSSVQTSNFQTLIKLSNFQTFKCSNCQTSKLSVFGRWPVRTLKTLKVWKFGKLKAWKVRQFDNRLFYNSLQTFQTFKLPNFPTFKVWRSWILRLSI